MLVRFVMPWIGRVYVKLTVFLLMRLDATHGLANIAGTEVGFEFGHS